MERLEEGEGESRGVVPSMSALSPNWMVGMSGRWLVTKFRHGPYLVHYYSDSVAVSFIQDIPFTASLSPQTSDEEFRDVLKERRFACSEEASDDC